MILRRVFRDAKLSTAVFIVMRTQDSAIMQASIISRTHPANLIQRDSPTLRLSAASIPLYDPKNVTIVSCTQIDWDLATRITASGQLRRLGEFVEFFQGEVNENNSEGKGKSRRFAGWRQARHSCRMCLSLRSARHRRARIYILMLIASRREQRNRDRVNGKPHLMRRHCISSTDALSYRKAHHRIISVGLFPRSCKSENSVITQLIMHPNTRVNCRLNLWPLC